MPSLAPNNKKTTTKKAAAKNSSKRCINHTASKKVLPPNHPYTASMAPKKSISVSLPKNLKKVKNKRSTGKIIFTLATVLVTLATIISAINVKSLMRIGLPVPFSLADISGGNNIPLTTTTPPQTNEVGENYFDNILFIGDSLTVGLQLYDYIPSSQVYALTGLNLSDALNKKFISFSKSSKQFSISQAVAKTKPAKIIFLMGINGIAWLDEKDFLDQYEELLRQIKSASPSSTIAVQSLYPVTAAYAASNPRINNRKISNLNDGIFSIAKELNMHYLDTASVLKDKSSNMKAEFSTDGMHLTKNGYETALKYIRTHPF